MDKSELVELFENASEEIKQAIEKLLEGSILPAEPLE